MVLHRLGHQLPLLRGEPPLQSPVLPQQPGGGLLVVLPAEPGRPQVVVGGDDVHQPGVRRDEIQQLQAVLHHRLDVPQPVGRVALGVLGEDLLLHIAPQLLGDLPLHGTPPSLSGFHFTTELPTIPLAVLKKLEDFFKNPLTSGRFRSNVLLENEGRQLQLDSFFKRYKGSYAAYVITFFFYFLAMALFSSVLSVYLTGIGKSATEMSFIVSAGGLFSFFVIPVIGYLNDRTRQPKLISGLLLVVSGLLGLLFAVSRSVIVLFLLDGFIMSFINSLMPICERMAGASRFRYGSLRVWGTLGYAVGAQCAGVVVERFPPLVLFALLLGACLVTIAGFVGTEDFDAPQAGDAAPLEKPRLSSLLQNRQFFLFLVVAFLFSACSGVNMNYAPVLLADMGLSTGAVGTVLFFSTLVEIPLILFSNRYMDRLSGKFLMAAALAIICVQCGCYGLTRSLAVVVVVMIAIKAIASTLYVMITLKMVRNLLGAEITTTGLSVVNSVNNLATILMQNAAGVLVDHSDIHTLYLVLCGLAVVGLLLTLLLKVSNREKVFA